MRFNDSYKAFVSSLFLIPFIFLNFSDSFHYAKELSFTFVFPIIRSLDFLTARTFDLKNRFLKPHWLVKENQKLNQKIDELEEALVFLKEFEDENIRLRELLSFRREISRKSFPAQVIGRDASQWRDSLMLNKGKKDGVSLKMTVVAPCGLLGTIVETGKFLSRMILTTDPHFKVSGLLQSNRVEGIVYGQGHGKLLMRYIAPDVTIYPNDIVLTSGLGGKVPKGLVLGSVKAVRTTEDGLFQQITVTPSFHFSSLEEVLILNDAKKS